MSSDFYAFGELLWDCLPSGGRHAGGAPFNVAAHLAQLGAYAGLISAVGQDALGDEILEIARSKDVDARFVARAQMGLPTGTVRVTLDALANATYEIVQPVAWDEIPVSADALAAVAGSRALVFGSLASRSADNLAALNRLLDQTRTVKFFDVNLRPPFAHPDTIVALARRADVVKLNDDEAGMLASWVRTGQMTPTPPSNDAALADAYATLADATGVRRLCVTRGSRGAAWWEDGVLVSVAAPPTMVRDTVGAGDAFMAGLVFGLTCGDTGTHRPGEHPDMRRVLENACGLGAYVASQEGATPPLPPTLVRAFGGTISSSD